jgi:hypothetical protein
MVANGIPSAGNGFVMAAKAIRPAETGFVMAAIAIRRAGNGFVMVTIGHPSAGTAFVMVARPLRALAPAVLRPMIVPWVCISDVVLLNTCIFV